MTSLYWYDQNPPWFCFVSNQGFGNWNLAGITKFIYEQVKRKDYGRSIKMTPSSKRPITGLPGKPSHKMGFRSSVSKSGHPGEEKHEALVPRNDVLTNGFI